MTEGPRFADVGPTSMHGPAHGALDGGADRGAHPLGRRRRGLGRGQPALRRTSQPHHPATHLAALDGRLGATDYTERGLPGGHIGMFVTTKSQGIVGNGMVD